MRHKGGTAAARNELVNVAAAMIAGTMNLIEGVRRITSLRYAVENPDDEVFFPIIAVDSETDHFPIGTARAECAPEYLRRIDQEIEKYLADAKPAILSACQEIIQAYSSPTLPSL